MLGRINKSIMFEQIPFPKIDLFPRATGILRVLGLVKSPVAPETHYERLLNEFEQQAIERRYQERLAHLEELNESLPPQYDSEGCYYEGLS